MINATHHIALRICDGAVGLLTMEELEKLGPVHGISARPIGVEIQGWVDENGVPIHELFHVVHFGTHPVRVSVNRYPATKKVRPEDPA